MKASYSLVGMQFRGTVDFVRSLPMGEPLTLIREPRNQYDRSAIQVWARATFVGFVKATEARALARRMDDAKQAQIQGTLTTSGAQWPLIEVEE